MKSLSVLLILIFFIQCQKSDSLAPEDDSRIVFGKNIDGITIGDDSTTVIDRLGRPDNIGIGDFLGVVFEYTTSEYAGMRITIFTETGTGVRSVDVAEPYSGKTNKVVGIGSTREDLHQSYRQPDEFFDNSTDIYTYSNNRFVVKYFENQIVSIAMIAQ